MFEDNRHTIKMLEIIFVLTIAKSSSLVMVTKICIFLQCYVLFMTVLYAIHKVVVTLCCMTKYNTKNVSCTVVPKYMSEKKLQILDTETHIDFGLANYYESVSV